MAAILCQGINEICKLLCVPCKACGLGCRSLGEVLWSPFFPYLTVTYALNVPAVVYGIQGFAYKFNHASNYCGSGTTWLMANTFLAASHLMASWYLVYTIRQDRDMSQMILGSQSPYNNDYGTEPVVIATPAVASSHLHSATTGTDDAAAAAKHMEQGTYQPPPPTNPTIFAKALPIVTGRATTTTTTTTTILPSAAAGRSTGASNSMTRIKYVLCYDPWVALYIVVFFVWVAWQSVGTSRAFKLSANGYQCDTISNWTMVSVICGYLYMGLVGIAFLCSLCCLR